MLIDWFTVGAQVINFLILVWLMKRFLYQPILNAIDTREKLIAAELANAAEKEAEALRARDEFQRKNAAFDQERAGLLSKATAEAGAEREKLIAAARQAADDLAAMRQESLRSEEQRLHEGVSRQTAQEVFAVARKALGDLAGASLEERMGEVFTRRLRALDGPAKAGLADALATATAPVTVRSAFDLPAGPRAAIQQALNETFAAEIPLHFATAPDLIGGIELAAGGHKVAWSIADYLTSLEADVGELLRQGTGDGEQGRGETEKAVAHGN
ncbi:F0F1 ATP synthase subunit delta [Oscillochloris sp. ZM17-4]|uniref:F0F1 ATP synthase subunit delta n=1 Tax=Oscillochloris sp. ZM17-4 TaxID=2866714 RepID=UPI001C733201|nr:F0F1 ATP synthase subunit delta [Oscillochloris sp. ZM17-4]MBX0328854.1 F0F1 ATP synthase subunit delta [Oscillochloris sp. ZM17-4]